MNRPIRRSELVMTRFKHLSLIKAISFSQDGSYITILNALSICIFHANPKHPLFGQEIYEYKFSNLTSDIADYFNDLCFSKTCNELLTTYGTFNVNYFPKYKMTEKTIFNSIVKTEVQYPLECKYITDELIALRYINLIRIINSNNNTTIFSSENYDIIPSDIIFNHISISPPKRFRESEISLAFVQRIINSKECSLRVITTSDNFITMDINTLVMELDRITAICYSPRGLYLACATGRYTVDVYGVCSYIKHNYKNKLFTLTGHNNSINSIRFSPHSKLIVTGSKDGFMFCYK